MEIRVSGEKASLRKKKIPFGRNLEKLGEIVCIKSGGGGFQEERTS